MENKNNLDMRLSKEKDYSESKDKQKSNDDNRFCKVNCPLNAGKTWYHTAFIIAIILLLTSSLSGIITMPSKLISSRNNPDGGSWWNSINPSTL
jgi:hypothetical protein